MSKKKVSGNTMTLKDFHGGSIPTDLPLPSAPGVTVRPSDRSDRPASWGNPMGRPDHRARPSSSPATRHFDDKTPFLTHTAHIGRNFDEDERKPLDGVSAPRRTVSDESIRALPRSVELKLESATPTRLSGQPGLAPVSQLPSGAVSSYLGRVVEGANAGVNPQNLGGNSGQCVSGSSPNVWAARREVAGVIEPVQSAWSGPSAVSKLAHASALEKVSSGRWQSKHAVQNHTEVEAIRYSEIGTCLQSKGYDNHKHNKMEVLGGRDYHDASLMRHVERCSNIEDGVQGGRKELMDRERRGAPVCSEAKERKPTIYTHEVQPARTDGKFVGSELQPHMHSEALERHKLKSLPRTKPLDSLEPPPVTDHKRGFQRQSDSGRVETVSELHGNLNSAKPVLPGTESGNRPVERPKLNLQPRSHTVEQLEGNIDRERNALFGGARPRELVLKERGIDDVAINSHDWGQPSDRVKHNTPKTETVPRQAIPSCYNEKTENLHLDRRIEKNSERMDHRIDVEKVDMQRKNWCNDNWRNKETEKQQEEERQPSPETWRKPVELPKPASPNAVGSRYGKAASAVELARAFSRSISDTKVADRYSGQRALPGLSQMPFSRLMGPTPRSQINGY